MKNFLLSVVILAVTASFTTAQSGNKVLSPPKSMSVSIDGLDVQIEYNAPSVRERKVFGEGGLEEYGKVWRTGANEATRITLSQNALVEGQALAKGTYSLFTIPGESKWTIIFNKVPKQWGAYSYDAGQDALRVEVESMTTTAHTEMLTFVAKDNKVLLKWDKTVVPFQISAVSD